MPFLLELTLVSLAGLIALIGLIGGIKNGILTSSDEKLYYRTQPPKKKGRYGRIIRTIRKEDPGPVSN